MKNWITNVGLLFCLAFFCIAERSVAQLATSTAYTPTQLVQNVLLGGGITATTITYSGAAPARGFFNGTLSNIGLDSGVVLSTGDIANAIGPNNTSSISTSNTLAGDPDLDQIMSPTVSYDATILEFDFVPTSDTVKFRYVFGSDEYMEWVGPPGSGGINDGFGFFISGPGIAGPFSGGAENIAIIPGTSLPVTMSNLSLISHSSFYFDNGDGFGTGTAPDGATVQYDGFTIPMTAIANVQCGQVYHIKIAIGDGGDWSLDSGVFLEAGSFASSGDIFVVPSTYFGGTVGGNDTTIYEGCGYASVLFDRGINNLGEVDTVIVTYSGTAANGTDFSFINDTIYYAVGQDSAFVTVNALPDALIEGTETVVMSIYTSTPCNGSDTLSLTLYIIDSPPLQLTLSNDTLINCPTTNIPLSAIASGGVQVGDYTYNWSASASTTDTVHVNPPATTMVYCTVSDSCGHSATDSLLITIIPYTPLALMMNNDTTICEGFDVFIDANVSGGRPDYTYSWNPAVSILDSVTVGPGATTDYILTVTDACNYTITENVVVNVYPIQANFEYSFTTNQNLAFHNGSTGAVTYWWNFGDGSNDSTSALANPVHTYINDGVYTVTLISTNIEGCSDTISYVINVLPDFYFYYPNAFSPNGNGLNDLYSGYGAGIKTYNMRIFDRWGEKLFETTDVYKGWDGTFHGTLVQAGVYVVMFELEGYHHEIRNIIGHVNVMR